MSNRLFSKFRDTFVGDRVLDPLMGTGATLVAAARAGRHCIGIDIQPAYVEYARQRLGSIATARVIQ